MTKPHRVLLFGGSFNPPTLAHEEIIARCLDLPSFDEVWLMPSGDRMDKTIPASDKDRLAMLELVRTESFASNPRLHVSRFELDLPRPTATYDTWHALRAAYPGTDFWFVFGRDSYVTMPDWPNGNDLRHGLSMVIFGDETGEKPSAKNVLYMALDADFSNISSTQARRALANNTKLTDIVSRSVARYMQNVILESSSQQ